MTHKSDFYTAKLPRYLKKMLAMGEARGYLNKEEARQNRLGFIEAHTTHLGYKMKRTDNRDTSSGE
jgi:hypothetical protein